MTGDPRRRTEFRDALDNDVLCAMYDYWRSLSVYGALPARRSIDPVEIPRDAIGSIVLADVIDGGARIRYRLVGTTMCRYWGQDFTGMHVDELMTGTYREFVEGLFADVIRTKRPVFSESQFRRDVGRAGFTKRLFCPLAEDGETIDGVLVSQVFDGMRIGPQDPVKVVDRDGAHQEVSRMFEQVAAEAPC